MKTGRTFHNRVLIAYEPVLATWGYSDLCCCPSLHWWTATIGFQTRLLTGTIQRCQELNLSSFLCKKGAPPMSANPSLIIRCPMKYFLISVLNLLPARLFGWTQALILWEMRKTFTWCSIWTRSYLWGFTSPRNLSLVFYLDYLNHKLLPISFITFYLPDRQTLAFDKQWQD